MTFTPYPRENAWHAHIACDNPGCDVTAEYEHADLDALLADSPGVIAADGWQRGADIEIVEQRPIRNDIGEPISGDDGVITTEAHERTVRGDLCKGCSDGKRDRE